MWAYVNWYIYACVMFYLAAGHIPPEDPKVKLNVKVVSLEKE